MATEQKDIWSSEVGCSWQLLHTKELARLTRTFHSILPPPPQTYQNAASFVPQLAGKVVGWLDVQKDDEILDIGCGGE